ncbi:uncharacterized protein MEPE_01165 [Melanopsichium pennsylvanicum]|uniref:Uncharacterized protein n=2 Tax=Melanopsichium pennsylvanicum TaxID=63383 RepID=A0AAJ4XHG4_9BASI|nr:putative protein [Melanopsichium pennsylvanicum 4]SNX82459.1 uncharacterized protein MEPE_01165 [Melanopsichium pennsylvanicum]
MLLSYCYIFSNAPSSTLETQPPPSNPPSQSPSPSPSIFPYQESLDLGRCAWSKIANWSYLLADTVKTFPSFVALHVTNQSSNRFASSSPQSTTSDHSLPGLTSWFTRSSSPDPPQVARAQVQASVKHSRSLFQSQQAQESVDPASGRTTFTFLLFGAASSTAVFLLVRNRRTMNGLQNAKSLAYRDARAWRRVALDFARINALAASRVQNLVVASLRDGQAGSEIGRQIERELDEAARAVAQRRNWIREQDAKDAEAASSSSQHTVGDAWGEIFNPDRKGFFSGSRAGLRCSGMGDPSRWHTRHAARHDDVSSDGVTLKGWQAWIRSTPSAPSATGNKHSAKQKWQRVAGLSVTSDAPTSPAPPDAKTAKSSTLESNADQQAEGREDWIGDVDGAIRARDLKSSQSSGDQAAVNAFSRHESEEYVEAITGFANRNVQADAGSEDHLLPVSDLNIATGGRLSDEPIKAVKRIKSAPKMQKTDLSPTKVSTTVSSTDKYISPISDRFRDNEHLFIAAHDDQFGLTNPPPFETSNTKPRKSSQSTVSAKPNSALFQKLRAQRASVKTEARISPADDIDFIADLMFPSAEQAVASPVEASSVPIDEPRSSGSKEQDLAEQLKVKEEEPLGYNSKINELSERLDSMRQMCHDLTDEAQRREKTHKIQVEQLDHKVGLFTVWAEEVQRRLGLETPSVFTSLRKPLKRD